MKNQIGLKKDMSQIFKEDGNVVPVTFVDVADIVVAHKKQ
jgi:ribosomal protein L3